MARKRIDRGVKPTEREWFQLLARYVLAYENAQASDTSSRRTVVNMVKSILRKQFPHAF